MTLSDESVSFVFGRISETPSSSVGPSKFARERSGRYVFKDWVEVAPGKYEARPSQSSLGSHPALISTAYRNANGLSTVYGLVFDLDVFDPSAPAKISADRKWEDAEGRLDWPRMARALRDECPELAAAVTHVVRSSGGRGLAVIVGINPLPIRPSTAKNQSSARSLQGRIAGLFSRLGFGPDPGARGLERDFPNWRDPSRVVFLNTSKVRSIESAREPVVTKLHRILNRLDKAREPFRLYRDARVEIGVARLALWLFGEFEPPQRRDFQISSELNPFGNGSPEPFSSLRRLGHFAEEQACATVRDLMHLTGLSEGFVRGLLLAPPAWLRVERISREEGWRLWVPLNENFGDLVARSRELHRRGKATTVGSAWDPRELLRPESVEDGFRNRWIVQVALSYKWAGLSYETALAKVRLRIAFVPGNTTSKNCRQVKKIVRNIYRRMPENEGRFPHRDLPAWLRDDSDFLEHAGPNSECSFVTRLNTGRGKAPLGSASESQLLSPPPPTPRAVDLFDVAAFEEHLGFEAVEILDAPRAKATVYVVRSGQRIGLIDKETGEVVVVITNLRHWRERKAEDWLAALPRYATRKPTCHSPSTAVQQGFAGAVRAWPDTRCASTVCAGKRETFAEAIERFRSRGDGAPEMICE